MNTDNKLWSCVAAITVLFGAAMFFRDTVSAWYTNFAVALFGILILVILGKPLLRNTLSWRLMPLLAAAAFGVALVAATHGVYFVATQWFPILADKVTLLYQVIEPMPPLAVVIGITAFVVLAEEIVWRGVAFGLLEKKLSGVKLVFSCTLLYCIPQIIAGIPILVAAAFGLGLLLTTMRLFSSSLVYPTITHFVWSASVFGLVPL